MSRLTRPFRPTTPRSAARLAAIRAALPAPGAALAARLGTVLARSPLARGLRDDTGAATAEYAVVIMAAVGFAGLLVVILKSGEVQSLLTGIVRDALQSAG
ncbi:MAG: DUF4244 domain-containing protein [Actinomycetales bacterium]|nr:DUF4244 domain-containing protein [Actinomycetales bacterium]